MQAANLDLLDLLQKQIPETVFRIPERLWYVEAGQCRAFLTWADSQLASSRHSVDNLPWYSKAARIDWRTAFFTSADGCTTWKFFPPSSC